MRGAGTPVGQRPLVSWDIALPLGPGFSVSELSAVFNPVFIRMAVNHVLSQGRMGPRW